MKQQSSTYECNQPIKIIAFHLAMQKHKPFISSIQSALLLGTGENVVTERVLVSWTDIC